MSCGFISIRTRKYHSTSLNSSKIPMIQQGDSYYFSIFYQTLAHFIGRISAKLPELNLVDTTRISNGTNSTRLALLYCQNFGRVYGGMNHSEDVQVFLPYRSLPLRGHLGVWTLKCTIPIQMEPYNF